MNGNVSKNTVKEYILENLSTGDFADNYTLEKNTSKGEVTLTSKIASDGSSVKGIIDSDGKVTWEGVNTNGTPSGGSSGTETATVTVTSSTAVGAAVEYNIPYTDVYTGTEFTKDNGWLFLSKTEEPAGSGKYTVNLMSAGIPAKVCYHYSTNVPGSWWGTVSQVAEKYGTTIANAGYDYNNGGYPNHYAATGLEVNFESIVFSHGTTAVENGKGCYTSINGISSEDVEGAIFKVAGSNVKVHNMTYDEANSLVSDAARKVGTGSSLYWLASPITSDSWLVYYVNINGDVYGYNYYTYGVRPVVSISGVTLSK